MANLPTNFKDDILDTSVNTRRRYRVYENTNGTIELEDVTEYSQVGDEFGAGQINAINTEVNKKFDKNMIVRDLDTINAITKEGYVPDALALKDVNDSLTKLINFLGYGGNNLPLIPTMTSNTTPSGVISSSGAISGYPLYQAFDNSDSTRCVLNQTSKAGSWLQYEFNSAVKALSARLVLSNAGNAVHSETWVVQGSNNGSTWDNISSSTTFTWSSIEDTLITQNIPLNGNAYSHYRIINTNISATSYPGIWTFQLYGSLF